MAHKPSQAQLFEELLARYETHIAEAFRAAVADLRNAADLQRIVSALTAGNINGAIEAMHLSPAAYNDLVETIREAYMAGGAGAVSTMPVIRSADGATAVVRFDGRNPRAEAWLRDHSSTLVTRIVGDQREAVREALAGAMARGANPKTAALDIVGRIDRISGQREGGILGLTGQQAGYVDTARQELASGDPAALRHYLTRTRRDKRFDRTVQKAIAAEAPVPAETINRAVVQYKNRLLVLRGETIGLTEALTSLQSAKQEAYLQAVEQGGLSPSAVRRTWRDAGDGRVRHTHRLLDGDTVGLYEPFRSPSGALLMYPGDVSLGAPAAEVVRCRCDVAYRIDFLANLG